MQKDVESRKIIIIFTGIILIFFVIVIALLGYRAIIKNVQREPKVNEITPIQPEPVTENIDTENLDIDIADIDDTGNFEEWTTYESDSLGIKFKYPNEFMLVDNDNFNQLLDDENTQEELKIFLQNKLKDTGADVILINLQDMQITISFNAPYLSDGGNFEDYVKSLKEIKEYNSEYREQVTYSEKEIQLGKLQGVEIFYSYQDQEEEFKNLFLDRTVFEMEDKYFEVVFTVASVGYDLQSYRDTYHEIVNSIELKN